jgi:molybdopterin-guanine dinucleotide biosynthesis protein A
MIPAYVLIGGKSTRMGRDKAQVEFDGKTFLERITDVLAQRFTEIVLVTGDGQSYSNGAIGFLTVSDIHPNCGPLGGIHAALSHTTSERIFVVSCDIPLLTVELLDHLLAHRDDAPIVVAAIDGRPQPLCGVYARSVLPLIDEHLRCGNYRMISLLEDAHASTVDSPHFRRSLINVNTMEELSKLHV